MLADVACDQAAEIIVAAAWSEADVDDDGLALVNRFGLHGMRRDV
jgi:hypothetical protein